MTDSPVLFSRPYRTASELANLEAVLASDHAHGDGPFTASATGKLKAITGAQNALLTTSCTHALEMASLLLGVGPGDEVILSSFTFASAATSVALFGGVPVFVDIEAGHTGDIDPEQIEEALTGRTKAISVMHYGGVAADLDAIGRIAAEHRVPVISDNAHGLGGSYRGRSLGTIAPLATQSFHDTKNVHCGEGGALLINDPELLERAEIVREKGTDRSRFLRGQVDKYTWNDVGSSYLLSELNAAVLDSQLSEFDAIQAMRHHIWDAYAAGLADWAGEQGVTLMTVPGDRQHTAHLFYLVLPSHEDQLKIMAHLRALGISAPFHYVPLDTSPAGRRFGRTARELTRSADFASRLIRLPLWAGMTDGQIERVIAGVVSFRMLRPDVTASVGARER